MPVAPLSACKIMDYHGIIRTYEQTTSCIVAVAVSVAPTLGVATGDVHVDYACITYGNGLVSCMWGCRINHPRFLSAKSVKAVPA